MTKGSESAFHPREFPEELRHMASSLGCRSGGQRESKVVFEGVGLAKRRRVENDVGEGQQSSNPSRVAHFRGPRHLLY